eukprot:EG_transcript_44604
MQSTEHVHSSGTIQLNGLLQQVFDSMAVNGKITMDQLPFVLAGAEVSATAEQVQEAIERHLPDADDEEAMLDYGQVQTLYHQLALDAMDVLVGDMVLSAEPQRRLSVVRRLWQWVQHKTQERR